MRDGASMAAQSDPTRNFHFRRRWLEDPPPLQRERPPGGSDPKRPNTIKSSSTQQFSHLGPLPQRVRELEDAAIAELQLGHIATAERLSQLAAELRMRVGKWA